MKYCVLIPAYQPDEKLIKVCEELQRETEPDVAPIIIVDDGSGEKYASIFDMAAEHGAVILKHEVNLGKGAAIKTGLTYISGNIDSEAVVTADADGQHGVKDILRVAQEAEERTDTLILGARDFSKMPFRSRAGNMITSFFFKLATGFSISDTQTGLRGFSRRMLEKLILLEGDRYEYEMNMLLKLKEMGFGYSELPIDTIYIENNASSHFKTLRDGGMVFSRVIKYSAASILSAAVDFGLYWLFLHWLSVSPSYIAARVCSALFNYECNRRAVFKSRFNVGNLLSYATLCIISMLLGSVLVRLLCKTGLNELISKLITDSLLFIGNYNAQKYIVFKKKG